MAWLGPVMLGGMIVGQTADAVIDSTKGVADECDHLQQAEVHYQDLQKQMGVILGKGGQQLKNYQNYLQTLTSMRKHMNQSTKLLKDKADAKKRAIETGIISFVVGLVVLLLFKYAGVFSFLGDMLGRLIRLVFGIGQKKNPPDKNSV